MPYRLRDGVSYCPVDGFLIFLDVEEDRYFRLSHRLERVFLAYLKSDIYSPHEVGELVRRNILVPSTTEGEAPHLPAVIAKPTLSLVEQRPHTLPFAPLIQLEVCATVCSTQWRLRRQRLSQILTNMAAYRQHKAARPSLSSGEPKRVRFEQNASTFRHARRYVPIETSCLLDSISLVRFLARRGLLSDLVFGVTHNPFAAHCWVQAEGFILNDTVGNVAAHTPIRKV